MKKNEILRLSLVLALVFVVFAGSMFALNLYTAPLIEANQQGAVFAPLLAVMPEGADFGGDALIYDAADPAASALSNIPEQVAAIYREKNGLGYAVRCVTSSKYSKEPMELTLGVTAEGIICGVQVDSYNESLDFRDKDPAYIGSFLNKDSALADVGIVAGTTFSSTAFKEAVSQGLGALISNGLIQEGVKSDAQILTEMIPTVHTGMAQEGNLKAEPIEPFGDILSGFASVNGSGKAFVMTEGENTFLAVCNADNVARLFDTEGSDVTADHPALAEAASSASGSENPNLEVAMDKFAKMIPDAENMTPVTLNVHNSVVAAAKFTSADATLYGFYAKSFGFNTMDIYFVIDENGAIVKMDAQTFIFDEEYFGSFAGMDKNAYREGFTGLTADTFDGSQALVATATMTSNAMKQATADAFAAFHAIATEEVQ